MTNTLFVFALESEACDQFSALPVLFTGVGKVNAAVMLAAHVARTPVARVINLGTAGSQKFSAGIVVNPTRFIQRDMNVTALGFAPYQTPFDETPPEFAYGDRLADYPEAVCGTGDQFETTKTGAEPWTIVDMEAYALARVCARASIPFTCLKYISDGADGAAHQDWGQALKAAAQALRRACDPFLS